jgi:hypothetical protein
VKSPDGSVLKPGCPHASIGSGYTLCSCPFWGYGEIDDQLSRRSLGTRDWRRVLKRIESYETGKVEAPPVRPIPQLGDAVDQYLADCETRKIRSPTRGSYRCLLEALKSFVGDPAVERIDTTRMTLFRNQRKVAASTMRKETEKLRSFFNFCVGQDWIVDNPMEG